MLIAKNPREAIQVYKKLQNMDPKWLPGYTHCGHAYLELKDCESALQQYLKSIRIANLCGQEINDPLLY